MTSAKAAPTRPELAVLVPVFNEAANVRPMVAALDAALAGIAFEVIFIDDWSTDGTAAVIADVAADNPQVRLIQRFGRRGLSTAVIEGAMATLAPVIAVIDGDLQHDETMLPVMLRAITEEGYDLAAGTRYDAGGSVGDWDARRAAGSRLATRLASSVLKTPLSDPMSGFFAVRRDCFLAAVPRLSTMGFKILLDLVASSPQPLRIREVPYTFRSRQAGSSKLDSVAALDFLMLLIDKRLGGLVSPRIVLFGFVGGLGVLVHLVTLRTVLGLGTPFAGAQTTAVLTAIAFNFFLNNSLTYRDRRRTGWGLLTGLLGFYLVCGIGALANVGVGSVVFANRYSWWVAGIAGAVVGSVWNYVGSSLLSWRKR